MGWSITPQDVEISSGGTVNFPPNDGSDKQWTVRFDSEDGKHCGEYTFTQKGSGPQTDDVVIKFTYKKGTAGCGDTFENYCFTQDDITKGYKVHTNDSNNSDVIPINIYNIVDKNSWSKTNSCTNGSWSWSESNAKEIFENALGCTQEKSDWNAVEHPDDPFIHPVTLILKNETDYYIPYSGRFKVDFDGQGVYIIYRLYSSKNFNQSTGVWEYHWCYGKNANEDQDTNFLLPPNKEITIKCMAGASLTGATNDSITLAQSSLSNLVSKKEDYDLHRGDITGQLCLDQDACGSSFNTWIGCIQREVVKS